MENQYLINWIPERVTSSQIRGTAEELLVLLVVAETHDPLDAGAVVPTAVEEGHFPRRRQMCDVSLKIPLRLFATLGAGRAATRQTRRVQPLRDPLDHAALAGGIAPSKRTTIFCVECCSQSCNFTNCAAAGRSSRK